MTLTSMPGHLHRQTIPRVPRAAEERWHVTSTIGLSVSLRSSVHFLLSPLSVMPPSALRDERQP